jgi:hypothetical protein
MAEHKESVLLYRILSEALSGEELESAVEQVRASGALQEELGGHMYVDTLLKLELGAVRIPERLPREIASRIRADEAKRRVAKPGGSRRRAHPVRRFRWRVDLRGGVPGDYCRNGDRERASERQNL